MKLPSAIKENWAPLLFVVLYIGGLYSLIYFLFIH